MAKISDRESVEYNNRPVISNRWDCFFSPKGIWSVNDAIHRCRSWNISSKTFGDGWTEILKRLFRKNIRSSSHPGWSEQKTGRTGLKNQWKRIKERLLSVISQVAGISLEARCMVWLLWIKMIMLFVRQFSGMFWKNRLRQST